MENRESTRISRVSRSVCVAVVVIGFAQMAQGAMLTDLGLYSSMDSLTLGDPGVCPDEIGGNDGDLYGSQQVNDPTRGNVLGTTVAADGVAYGDVMDAGTGSLTVACWIKLPDTDSTVTLANKGMETSSAQNGWRMVSSSTDYFHVWANYGNSTASRLGVKTTYVPDDAWHHFAFVVDQEHGVLKAYLDGNPSSDDAGNFNSGWMLSGTSGYANTFTPGTAFENSNSLNIAFPGASTTVAKYDDFAVWTRALGDAEIASLAGGAAIVPEPSTLIFLIGMLAAFAAKRIR